VLAHAQTGESFASLILIDLDGFKKINDLHGHQAGDALLCEIGRRMETTTRQHDRVARLGGDEFALLAQGRGDFAAQGHGDFADHEAGVIRLADRLISAIQQPILTNDGWLAIAA
jgi:GGDEF domain-containing protein